MPGTRIQPAQWFDRTRFTPPIERLAVAVIEAALRDYRQAKHRKNVGEWVQNDDDAPISLRWTCDLLRIDLGYARNRLLAYLAAIDQAGAVMSLIRWE
jgi:hypothetical protein